MKKGFFLSMIIILAMTVNIGCEALDITEEITFDITFYANSTTADFFDQELLDADSLSSVIADYSSKIKGIEVLEVTYQITSVGAVNEASKVNTSTLTVADENGAGTETIATVSNVDIVVMAAPVALQLEQGGINRLADLIKNQPHRALLTNSGTANGSPLDFTVIFRFKIKMTARPL